MVDPCALLFNYYIIYKHVWDLDSVGQYTQHKLRDRIFSQYGRGGVAPAALSSALAVLGMLHPRCLNTVDPCLTITCYFVIVLMKNSS